MQSARSRRGLNCVLLVNRTIQRDMGSGGTQHQHIRRDALSKRETSRASLEDSLPAALRADLPSEGSACQKLPAGERAKALRPRWRSRAVSRPSHWPGEFLNLAASVTERGLPMRIVPFAYPPFSLSTPRHLAQDTLPRARALTLEFAKNMHGTDETPQLIVHAASGFPWTCGEVLEAQWPQVNRWTARRLQMLRQV